MTRQALCAAGLLVVLLVSSLAAGEGVPAQSKVEAVTLYRGQALVARTVALPARAGQMEVVVGDLPAQVVPGSVSASAAGEEGVTIRSVRYRSRAVAATPHKEVAALDARVKEINQRLYVNREMAGLVASRAKYVEMLQGFTAATAKAEAGQGVMNPKMIADTSDYILKQLAAVTDEKIKLHEEAEALQEELKLLQRKRAELTRGSGASAREAAIFLFKSDEKAGQTRLEYLGGSSNWSPAPAGCCFVRGRAGWLSPMRCRAR